MRPQQFFVHPSVASVLIIDDGQSFPNAVATWRGQRVTTPCWECLWLHPFCPGARHSPCLGRGAVATIAESCCVLYLMV